MVDGGHGVLGGDEDELLSYLNLTTVLDAFNCISQMWLNDRLTYSLVKLK